jgi:LysR family transcriptional regulator, transcriptional activator of nhaA
MCRRIGGFDEMFGRIQPGSEMQRFHLASRLPLATDARIQNRKGIVDGSGMLASGRRDVRGQARAHRLQIGASPHDLCAQAPAVVATLHLYQNGGAGRQLPFDTSVSFHRINRTIPSDFPVGVDYGGVLEWFNYHHLLYFWVVAREGSIVEASRVLRLGQPTISHQIHQLEAALGDKLFVHRGRRLVLTDLGKLVFRYAEQIFTLGQELVDTVQGRDANRPTRLAVGVADVLPKFLVHRLLLPALKLGVPVQLTCRENRAVEEFFAELTGNELDLVLSDRPVGPSVKLRAFNHLLGECGTAFLASAEVTRQHRRAFPASLDGAPMLLPTQGCTLRRTLDAWLDRQKLRPRIVGEFDDSELMYMFGQKGAGIFPVPDRFATAFCAAHGVSRVGRVAEVRQQFFAISIERRLKNRAVVAVCEAARAELLAPR